MLAPGGALLAITPNNFGYVAVVASLVPNSLHDHVLRFVQPQKSSEDTFPTRYRMNTHRALQRLFGPFRSLQESLGDPHTTSACLQWLPHSVLCIE